MDLMRLLNYGNKRAKAEKRWHRWTEKENNWLIENYRHKGAKYCAEHLGRTVESIWVRAGRLGLSSEVQWTKEDEQAMLEMIKTNTAEEVAKKLNRTESAIYKRVHIATGMNIRDYRKYAGIN